MAEGPLILQLLESSVARSSGRTGQHRCLHLGRAVSLTRWLAEARDVAASEQRSEVYVREL